MPSTCIEQQAHYQVKQLNRHKFPQGRSTYPKFLMHFNSYWFKFPILAKYGKLGLEPILV